MLKLFIKALEDVDEKFRGLYKQTEGGFMLEVDDKDFKSRLDEFRNNNIALKKEKERLEAEMQRFKGIDPDKYEEAQEALKKVKALEEKKLLEAGEVDKVVEQRVAEMRRSFEAQVNAKDQRLKQLEGENGTFRGRLGALLIDQGISEAVSKFGQPRKGAIADIRNRAHALFQVDNEGNVKPLTGDGKGFDSEGNPLTFDTFAKRLLDEAPYLFEPSSGGGAGGGKKQDLPGGAQVLKNPDPHTFGLNLEDIASGKKTVVSG
jgi:hypothetical protein